jgi:tetratricopeptide (TPR) repeat protein
MTTYEQYIALGENLRTKRHHPRTAIKYYQRARNVGGDRDRHCQQMIGVCHQMVGRYEAAIEWYFKALEEEGASDYERGNIERDLAESYGNLGWLDLAETSLLTSLDLLPYEDHPAKHAASLGFLARLYRRQGRLAEALEVFADADQKLRRAEAYDLRLYNKLHQASALSRAGRRHEMIRAVGEALALIPDHGSPGHRRRAMILLYGGWRADALALRLKRLVPWLVRSLTRSR